MIEKDKKKVMSVGFPHDIATWLDAQKEKTKVPRTRIIFEAIRQYMAREAQGKNPKIKL